MNVVLWLGLRLDGDNMKLIQRQTINVEAQTSNQRQVIDVDSTSVNQR